MVRMHTVVLLVIFSPSATCARAHADARGRTHMRMQVQGNDKMERMVIDCKEFVCHTGHLSLVLSALSLCPSRTSVLLFILYVCMCVHACERVRVYIP
jgi:hypothetical protein